MRLVFNTRYQALFRHGITIRCARAGLFRFLPCSIVKGQAYFFLPGHMQTGKIYTLCILTIILYKKNIHSAQNQPAIRFYAAWRLYSRQLGKDNSATRQPFSEGSRRTMLALAVSGV